MRPPRARPLAVVTVVLGLAAAAALTVSWRRAGGPADPRVLPKALVRADAPSNILPGDYAGSAACAECHAKNHALWLGHPHRTMNQHPHPGSVKGDFDNAALAAGRGRVVFRRDAGRYLMTITKDGKPEREFVVTRTIGGRHMQFYAGRLVKGPEPPDSPAWDGETRLPFAYWFRFARWLPIDHFDQGGPEETHADGRTVVMGVDDFKPHSYSGHCMNCHNTMPYAYRIFRPQLVGFPGATVAADPFALRDALASTVAVEPTAQGFSDLNPKLDPDRHLVHMGIGCESCHFGAAEHARTEAKLRFLPEHGALRVSADRPGEERRPTRHDPRTVVGICTQCHAAAVPVWPNGAGVANSREGLDLAAGHCASQMSCVHCHEPHTAGEPSGIALPARHAAACVKCHTKYGNAAAAQAHGRHTPGQANCLDCHMPRYSQGIQELSHCHRVCAPVERSMVAEGAPNACNLCHLDKSVNWTLAELKKGWGRDLGADPAWATHYGGSLDNPVGSAWLTSSKGAHRLVGAAAYGRSPLGRAKLPDLLAAMNDAVPANRAFAQLAVERVLGRRLRPDEFDQVAPPAVRGRQVGALQQTAARR